MPEIIETLREITYNNHRPVSQRSFKCSYLRILMHEELLSNLRPQLSPTHAQLHINSPTVISCCLKKPGPCQTFSIRPIRSLGRWLWKDSVLDLSNTRKQNPDRTLWSHPIPQRAPNRKITFACPSELSTTAHSLQPLALLLIRSFWVHQSNMYRAFIDFFLHLPLPPEKIFTISMGTRIAFDERQRFNIWITSIEK